MPPSERDDHLDAYLDDLVQGWGPDGSGLDTSWVETVSRLHTAEQAFRLAPAARNRLRRSILPPAVAMHREFRQQPDVRTTARSSSVRKGALIPPATPGQRPLSWIASALLLVMVATAGGFAWLGLQRDDPTSSTPLFAGASGTPESSLSTKSEQDPTYQECAVTPRTLDNVLAILQRAVRAATADSHAIPTPFLPASDPAALGLPAGPAPDADSVAAVTVLYGEYWGCVAAGAPLRTASLLSDDGLLRLYDPAGKVDVAAWNALGFPPTPGATPTNLVGMPVPEALWGFTQLGPDRIGAYIALRAVVQIDGTPVTSGFLGGDIGGESVGGYVVFVRVDGRWLIDDRAVSLGKGDHDS